MKIGFDAKRLFNNFTGLGNYSRFVVQSLADHFPEHNYTLYTPRAKNNLDTTAFLNSDKYKVRLPDAGLARTFSSYWRSVSLGRVAASDGMNIFHGLSNELPLARSHGIRMILTVHDLIFRRFPELYNPLDVRIYSYKLQAACERADRIVAVSQQTAEDLKEFMKVDERKIHVVYQGCHSSFKKSFTEEEVRGVRSKYKLPETFVLMVGTIEKRKNASLLLRAASIMKEKVPMVLVGRKTNYQQELEKVIADVGIQDNVIFIHDASFQDLPILYQAASVFVYPSLFEGFGIPIVEAIASQVPVITSTGSCFSEAGGPDCIYINPTDAEALAVAISRVLENSSLRNEMKTRSTAYISRFEPGVIAGDLMKIYTEVLS